MQAPVEIERVEVALARAAGLKLLGAGFVPDQDIAFLFFPHGITVYIRVVDGKLVIDTEAPTLQ